MKPIPHSVNLEFQDFSNTLLDVFIFRIDTFFRPLYSNVLMFQFTLRRKAC